MNSPKLDVRAITVVPENVTAQRGLENALRMVSLAKRCDIPVAVGVAIDSTLVTAPPRHVDVQTRGELTRGETVANRRGEIERNVFHADAPGGPAGGRYTSSKASIKPSPTPKYASRCRPIDSCNYLCLGFKASNKMYARVLL